MDWTQQSQIMDESFPKDFLLDTQSIVDQSTMNKYEYAGQVCGRNRRSSLPLPVSNVERRKLHTTLPVIPSHNETNDTSGFESKGNSPKNDSFERLSRSELVQDEHEQKRSQSKDSGESIYSSHRYSRQRAIATFRERSRSEVDFKAINRKKYAHVQSKVKRYIDQISRDTYKPRVVKQKSMPELHESQREPNNTTENDCLAKTTSTNSIPNRSAFELEDKDKIIQELREYVNQLESNCQDRQEENYVLKKKIEQMRGKLYQIAERRSSVPVAPAVTFYESQIDIAPFSSIVTPIRKRPLKLVASKSIQTSFRDDHHTDLNERNDQESFIFAINNRALFDTTDDGNVKMKRATSEVIINTIQDPTQPEFSKTPNTTPPIDGQDSEGNFRRSLLDKSRSSFHQLHVSFKSNNSYHIFDETNDGKAKTSSDRTSSTDVTDKNNKNNFEKEKKLSIFRKILKCFRSEK